MGQEPVFGIIFSSQKVDLYTSKYSTFDMTDQKEKQKAYMKGYMRIRGDPNFN